MFAGAAPLLLAGLSCGVGFILARLKSRADFSKQVVPEAAIEDSAALDVLFIGHTLLELWLGMIKLRGRYQHEAPGSKTPRSEMYTRHHGASILALALLGYFVWARGLANTPTGQMASAVLATFHGGATIAFIHAWCCGAIPFAKVIIPHLPFAVAFAWHAWSS